MFHGEALHGAVRPGATIFPAAVGLGATWDPGLLEKVFSVAGRESRRRQSPWSWLLSSISAGIHATAESKRCIPRIHISLPNSAPPLSKAFRVLKSDSDPVR